MGRRTVRGTIRSAARGRSTVKRRIQQSSPKARMRRSMTRTLGMPTTARGWNSASRSFYRRNFGCYTLIIMALVMACAIAAIVIAIF